MKTQRILATILAATLASLALATAASAGECPAEQVMPETMAADGHTENLEVTDTVLAVNHLADYYPELASRDQRVRYLTVAPGGEVAWHDHSDRPALIYIISGQIVEHRSNCAVPIVHMAGDVATEIGPLQHWWKNETNEPVEILSADLLRVTH